ncbi:MAG: HEPN domain-containing protein [Actinomycetota bacterium]
MSQLAISSPATTFPCFLAHLAAEKALKAMLIALAVPFKKTHDLIELARMLVAAGRPVEFEEARLKRLNPWVIEGRYADNLAEASRALAVELIEIADDIVSGIGRALMRNKDA